jgi:hypothetical protein
MVRKQKETRNKMRSLRLLQGHVHNDLKTSHQGPPSKGTIISQKYHNGMKLLTHGFWGDIQHPWHRGITEKFIALIIIINGVKLNAFALKKSG